MMNTQEKEGKRRRRQTRGDAVEKKKEMEIQNVSSTPQVGLGEAKRANKTRDNTGQMYRTEYKQGET